MMLMLDAMAARSSAATHLPAAPRERGGARNAGNGVGIPFVARELRARAGSFHGRVAAGTDIVIKISGALSRRALAPKAEPDRALHR